MAAVWNEAYLCDGFGVVFVGVYELLRYEVLRFVLSSELDVEVGRHMHVCSPLVVVLLAALELRRFTFSLCVVIIGACELLRRSFRIPLNVVLLVYDLHLFIAAKLIV